MACGSIVSQAPASRSRPGRHDRPGRTTRTAGMAVVLTIAALAEAAASKTCCELHQGGNTTATTSAPGRTCKDSAAIAIQLATSNAAAFSHAGHAGVVMLSARSIPEPDTGIEAKFRVKIA